MHYLLGLIEKYSGQLNAWAWRKRWGGKRRKKLFASNLHSQSNTTSISSLC